MHHFQGRGRLVSVLMGCALAACSRAPTPAAPVTTTTTDPGGARIQADVRTLADDAMQGRLTGTPGFDRAADAVAARFRALGLQPAGDGGSYFQRVPLLQATRLAQGAMLQVIRRDRTIALRFGDQYLTEPDFDRGDASVRAPAVFVGQGVSAPDLGHDDFAGLDLHGRIAVVLGGAPATLDEDRRAFAALRGEKLRALAQRGAIGAVFIDTAEDEARAPWATQAGSWDEPQLRLRDAAGRGIDSFAQLRVVARVSAAAADLLLDGSGHTAAELAQAAQAGTLHGFVLPMTLALAARTHVAPLDSRNVVARLPGRDRTLAQQAIVFSAHLDHLGIGPAVDGDAIRNGALDNALGVAIVLEAAQRLQHAAPRRSLLFLATTGEEQGLLGAQWFASHPPQPLLADINVDMPMLLVPTRDVVPIGARHSSLQGALDSVARALQVGVSPEPFPEEAMFVRSDQFAFVRAGVPSLYLDGGVVPGAASAGKPADAQTVPKLAQREFLRRCYHRPCDDIRQPIQYADAARMAALAARLGRHLGDAARAPQWNRGDFFGQHFAAAPEPSSR